jgi:hypothetical protein
MESAVTLTKSYDTILYQRPDMQHTFHELARNTYPSHHVQEEDTQVPTNCSRAEEQAIISRHSVWLVGSFKRQFSTSLSN